jgi:hypothetical protein
MRRIALAMCCLALGACSEENQVPLAPTPALRRIASGLTSALYVTYPPGDSTRIFVVQQNGIIRVMRRDTLLVAQFLNVASLIAFVGERGLLSMAFDPAYATNRAFYIDYTDKNGNINLVRYRTQAANPNVADPASAEILLTIPHSTYPNHNGGLLLFGPDGYLYMGTGDGGSGGDPNGNGQDSTTLLGKILRLDVSGASPYTIPPTNPFAGRPPAAPEVWAYGLRNPWRFSFDRLTHDLYIGDVGQNALEEVDFAPASSGGGENYGWNTMEGLQCYKPSTGCSMSGLVLPVYDYGHSNGDCSVTGGYVYRGTAAPSLVGRYFFAEYCGGWVRSLKIQSGMATDVRDHATDFGSLPGVTSFGEDARGELYITLQSGEVYRIAPE